jgi:membrane-bound serine protease (ClpP class)
VPFARSLGGRASAIALLLLPLLLVGPAGQLLAVLLAAAALATAALLVSTREVRARRRLPLTGAEGMIGELGEVVHPESKVFVHGEYWNARIPPSLPRGARIRVVNVIGARLEVEGEQSCCSRVDGSSAFPSLR